MNHFRPHRGAAYGAGAFDAVKLMIVGESHYNEPGCLPCDSETTSRLVESHVAGDETPFLTYIETIAGGSFHAPDRHDFWASVAFANFVQRPMADQTHRPTAKDFEDGLAAFWLTVTELRPDLVFIFSVAYDCLPSLLPFEGDGGSGSAGGKWLWRYVFLDGHEMHVARFNHRNARHNPPPEVWRAWADRCWKVTRG